MLGRDLSRPTHGVRTAGTVDSLIERAAATWVALPGDAAFSHATAAQLWGLPLPRDLEDGPLTVMRSTASPRIRRVGCEPRRGLESREVQAQGDLRLTGLADTWCDLGELLALDDLVVLGDAVANRLGDVAPLGLALGRRVRPRGAVLLREALTLVRMGSDSPMESRCRLLFGRAGLPEPELNAVVTDRVGTFLCRADFLWRRKRVIAEYQGADHFGSFERGDDDISRRLLAQDDGWTYVEITKRDYFTAGRRHQLVNRLSRYLLDP
jgi:hypothetical protein